MERTVTVKKWYVVTGTAGATVTSPDGSKTFCTVPEGGQGVFYATIPKVVTSDDSVEVVETTFNSAPVKLKLLGLLGGGGVSTGLPAGYLQAEFVQNSGRGCISTLLKAYGDTTVECEFVPTQYHWVNGVYMAGSHDSNPGFFGSYDFNNAWGRCFNYAYGESAIYFTQTNNGIGKITSTLGKKYTIKQEGGAFYIDGVLRYELPQAEFETANNISFLGGLVNDNAGVKNLKLYRASVARAGVKQRDFVPAVDSEGKPCLFDKVEKIPRYFVAHDSGAVLVVGMDMKQASKLGTLPNTGGSLTVSLPWEAIDDAKVQAALARAAENGWTIIEQYREPDATTENIEADFLEGTGEQYMKLPLVLTTEDSVRIVQEHFCTAKGQFFEGVNTINNDKCVLRVGQYDAAYYLNRGNGWTTGKVPLNQWVLFDCYFYGTRGRLTQRDGTFTERDWGASAPCKEYWLWRWKDSTSNKWNGKKKYFKVEVNEAPYCDMVPTLDSNGVPCLFDKVTNQAFYNKGTGAFIVGFETVEAARRLARLPKVEAGELTVSLPAEARDAASMVPSALSIAASRGWTIIEQYRED